MSITRYEQVVTRTGNYIMPNPQGAWVHYDDHMAIYKTGCDMIAERDARIAELEAVVERLPHTKDKVPITPDDWVYSIHGERCYVVFNDGSDRVMAYEDMGPMPSDARETGYYHPQPNSYPVNECYSTEAAALAAKGQP